MLILFWDTNWSWNVAMIMNIAHIKILIYLHKIFAEIQLFKWKICKKLYLMCLCKIQLIFPFYLCTYLISSDEFIKIVQNYEHRIEKIDPFCVCLWFFDIWSNFLFQFSAAKLPKRMEYGPKMSPSPDGSSVFLTYENDILTINCQKGQQCTWQTLPNKLQISRKWHLQFTVPVKTVFSLEFYHLCWTIKGWDTKPYILWTSKAKITLKSWKILKKSSKSLIKHED